MVPKNYIYKLLSSLLNNKCSKLIGFIVLIMHTGEMESANDSILFGQNKL